MLGAVACSSRAPEPRVIGPQPTRNPPPVAVVPAPEPADSVTVALARLTTRQKVAQLVMPWLLGDYVSADDPSMRRAYAWVDSLEVGGIIISTGTPLDVASKLNALQRRAPLPLLIAADFEGGIVMRIAAGTAFPTQMGIGATGRTEDAYQLGRITAVEGRAVGVHLAFAPVADVNSNPANPIINTRAFGADPHAVAELVAATVRGMRDGGILSTAKHFPGHGDTETDSHLAMPVITAPWARFDSLELVPFRAAIDAGVDAVMSAHIALPALDGGSRLPGTLSPAILTGILRDSLQFKGLITTDALDMGGIAKEVSADEAVIRAFEAGSDLLLMPADPAAAITAVTRAVESGRISMARLDLSVRKILELKARMGLFEKRDVDLTAVPDVVGGSAHKAIARDITERSLVLLKDGGGTVAAMRAGPQRIALVTVGSTTLGSTLAAELRRGGHTVSPVLVPAEPTARDLRRIDSIIGASKYTVLATSVRWGSYQGTIGLAKSTADLLTRFSRRRPTVLVSFGSPYVISQVPTAGSYLIGWSNTPVVETAVGAALTGRNPITGKAPIPIPPSWPIQSGIVMPEARP